MEENGDQGQIVRRVAVSTEIDLTPQKSTDSDNTHDLTELGRHAAGTFEVDDLRISILMQL